MPQGDVIQIRYPVLFQMKVLHHYFLDIGKTLFDNLSDLDKLRVLAEFDVRKIIQIKPTPLTQLALDGLRILFKQHALGFTLLCHGDSNGQVTDGNKPELGEKLRFTIKVIDPYFFQYSAGFLKNQTERVLKSTDGKVSDRFFKPIYLLKNDVAGQSAFIAAEPVSYDTNLTYAPEAIVQHDSGNDGNPEFFIAQTAVGLNAVPSLNPNADWTILAQVLPQNTNVRYVTQADLTELELGEDISNDAFAVIEVEATAGAGPTHLYDGVGNLKQPEFELRFKNRLTWWRHSLPSTVVGPLTSITQTEALPLTFQGKQKIDLTFQVTKDNATVVLEKKGVEVPSKRTPVLPEIANNGSVIRLLSDVYI